MGDRCSLLFPQNINGTDTSAPYAVIEFDRPDQNGLPIWGVGNGGITVCLRRRTTFPAQQGYYAGPWYAQGDGSFDGSAGYWGGHLYPPGGSGTSVHYWEVAAMGQDWLDYQSHDFGFPADPLHPADYGITVNQIIQVERISANLKTATFYTHIENRGTAAPYGFVLGNMDSANYGDSDPPNPHPMYYYGDSRWFASFQHERAGNALDAWKTFTPMLSLSDAQKELDFTGLKTAAGISNLWYGKDGFRWPDDMECSYGSGRAFVRNDSSNLLALVPRMHQYGAYPRLGHFPERLDYTRFPKKMIRMREGATA